MAMSRNLNDEMTSLVKDLIKQVSKFEETSEGFKQLEKNLTNKLIKADTMYFLNKKDMDQQINSMAEKFVFHGFFKQATNLKIAYNNYIKQNLPRSELTNRLNIIKFLLCMSESPTNNFWKYSENFIDDKNDNKEEEIIDWGKYLNEGIEPWKPSTDDDDDNNLDTDSSTNSSDEGFNQDQTAAKITTTCSNHQILMHKPEKILNIRKKREELLAKIQHTWFNGQSICMKPPSEWREANMGILWEEFLKDQVKGIIDIEKITVISEYKVMREIMWQLFGLHNSVIFQIIGNKLVVRDNVTISSVRSTAFQGFLQEFVIYMNLLHNFREFFKSTEPNDECPITYQNYANSLRKILEPIYQKLIKIEAVIREQEITMTLLKLAGEFKEIFEPVLILHGIHESLLIDDFRNESNLLCVINLLKRLHKGLQYTLNKLEHDLRLTLYMDSLSYYLNVIDIWFVKNFFNDYTNEFIILNRTNMISANDSHSIETSENWQLKFVVDKDIEEICQNDGVLKIITGQVLQIGRDIHLLRLLGNFEAITTSKETIHQELVRRTLEEIDKYYQKQQQTIDSLLLPATDSYDVEAEAEEGEEAAPATYYDFDKDLIDVSDGFLMKAFEKYLKKPIKTKPTTNEAKSLFERINQTTTNLFPTKYYFENLLGNILKENFTISGLMVKNLLIVNYKLDKQLQFLRDLFLFNDNFIFPFYCYLFNKINHSSHNKYWGNAVWLTAHLHDVINDIYPDFYVNCKVQIQTDWQQCQNSLECCHIINLQYQIDWPLNIIITSNHLAIYKELFQFILKLKWALYTLNHLVFVDLEEQRINKLIRKLQFLRFSLINITNNIQHFLFGYVFNKYLNEFEFNFNKANNLESLMFAHSKFVNSIYGIVREIVDCVGFVGILDCVLMLEKLWTRSANLTYANLMECYELYQFSYNIINPIVNPVFIF